MRSGSESVGMTTRRFRWTQFLRNAGRAIEPVYASLRHRHSGTEPRP